MSKYYSSIKRRKQKMAHYFNPKELGASTDDVLLETGDSILLESGDKMKLEA